MAENGHDQMGENTRTLLKKLDAVGWGVFFIWIGIALLADVGWGVGLLGVGVITLGAQAARKYFGLPVERFGLVIGIVFVLWGVWELLKIQLGKAPIPGGLLPILFIVVGTLLTVSALLRKRPH
jgi:hypothetical protein